MKHKYLLLWLLLLACWLSALSNTSLEEIFDPSAPAVDATLSTTIITTLSRDNDFFSPSTIRHTCIDLRDQDRNVELLSYLEDVERFHGSLEIDEELPTLYNFKAVALYELGSIHEAGLVLKRAVAYNNHDLRSWINLLEIFHYDRSLGSPQQAIDMVEHLSGQTSLNERYSSLCWTKIEWLEHRQDRMVMSCLRNTSDSESCETIVFGPSRYFDEIHLRSFQSFQNKKKQSSSTSSPNYPRIPPPPPPVVVLVKDRRLVVGFIFGIIDGGPVPKLLSSLMRRFDKRKITTVAYILSTTNTVKEAWIIELLSSFDERVSLSDMDFRDSATIISRRRLHVLVDVNGYQLLSGVTLMRLRPCGLQINYLGDALTSNLDYMDYYIGDRVSNPPDINSHYFTEKLSLLSTSYLSNSYLDQTVDILIRPAYPKEDLIHRLALNIAGGEDQRCKRVPVEEDTILLGAFHGHSKITPMLFQVWMNILRSARNSRLVMSPPSSSAALTNLIGELNYAGIMSQCQSSSRNSSSRNSSSRNSSSSSSSSRVLILPHSEWFEHVYYKSAVDVYMDTIIKNGHTTTMDAAWGGIPILGLAGQSRATQRSTESIIRYLLGDLDCCGLVYSLKEYEDVVIALIKTRRGRRRLEHWKRVARLMRLQSSFFNPIHFADSFTRNLQVLYEVHSIHSSSYSRVDTLYHIFHSSSTLN